MPSDTQTPSWRSKLSKGFREAQPSPSLPLSALMGTALFHYTTAEGLKGIFQDNCLWATAASYLNDASEVEYGCAMLEQVLRNWQVPEGKNIRSEVIGNLRRVVDNAQAKYERAMTIYVACFCRRDNLLSQWRAYGQAGGYSIGFSMFEMGVAGFGPTRLKPESSDYRAKLVPVIYDRKQQFQRLEAVLNWTLPVLEQPDLQEEVAKGDEKARQHFMALSLMNIEHYLIEEIVSFKNAAFAEENEWRIVVRPKSPLPFFENKKDPAVHMRTGRGLIIPYVKLVPTNDKLPIESVRFGPSLDKTRAENSLKVLLSSQGYRNVKIHGSDIPVILG